MSFFLLCDEKLFHFLNRTIANPVFDVIMPFVTNLNNWKIPILLFWLFLIFKGGKKGRIAAILIIPVLVCGDQLAAFVIKPWVARLRPCHAMENVRLLVSCGGKYSFPSNHATNITGFAMLFTLIYRKYWYWFWGIAVMISFSRIYVGVHYPLDVLGGMVLGSLIGLFIYYLYKFWALKYPSLNYSVKLENVVKN